MAISASELDTMQSSYKSAVDKWIEAIRHEEALASTNHNETEIDLWEGACNDEEAARKKAKAAKSAYEAALREEFFNF